MYLFLLYFFKAYGVFIEWKFCDEPEDQPDSTWVIEGGSPPLVRAQKYAAHTFSCDLKDIRSYTYTESKKGIFYY